MQPANIDYDTFISEFQERSRITTHENTKQQTIVHVGIWNNKYVALKNCYSNNEAQLYSKIKPHPNIVTLLSIIHRKNDSSKTCTYILMEANSGVTLADTVIYREYNLVEVLHIMINITKGLQHLHNCGIIHHDIKKSNILVMDNHKHDNEHDHIRYNEIYKICDFGLSEYIDNNGYGSEHYRKCGSKPYLAPEKTKDSTIPLTTKVDIFAMGVLGMSLIDPDSASTNIDKFNTLMTRCRVDNYNDRPNANELLEQLLQLQTYVL